MTAIRHPIVDYIRRTRRRPALVLHAEVDWNADPSVSPLQRLIMRENLGRYAKALACLGDRDRQLIILRLVKGLSCLDVAVRLGMPSEAAVQMAVRRAMRRLHKHLAEAEPRSQDKAWLH